MMISFVIDAASQTAPGGYIHVRYTAVLELVHRRHRGQIEVARKIEWMGAASTALIVALLFRCKAARP